MFWNRNDPDTKLERRVRDLEASMARLESESKQLRMEWEKTFEQVMNALRRLGKRARDAADGEPAAPPKDPPANPQIAAIMARRALRTQLRNGHGIPQ